MRPRNPYPEDWETIAGLVKDLAENCCEACGHPHDYPSGHVLTVHHLDDDPANNRIENLVALCQRCHLSIQSKFFPGQSWLAGLAPEWATRRGLADPLVTAGPPGQLAAVTTPETPC